MEGGFGGLGEILIPLASPFEKEETTFENFYVFSFEKSGG
jgi:hypothetical protein